MLMFFRLFVSLLTMATSSQGARIGHEVCFYLLLLLNIIIRVTAWDSEFYVNDI